MNTWGVVKMIIAVIAMIVMSCNLSEAAGIAISSSSETVQRNLHKGNPAPGFQVDHTHQARVKRRFGGGGVKGGSSGLGGAALQGAAGGAAVSLLGGILGGGNQQAAQQPQAAPAPAAAQGRF